MKKRLLILIAIAASLNVVQAQTASTPDAYGYVWRTDLDPQGPAYNWIDITTNPAAVLVTGLTDDNVVGPFTLNTPFHYYWYNLNKFYIGSNGYIGFTNGLIASGTNGFPTIPISGGTNNYIAPFMTDLIFTGAGNTGQCYYYQSPGGDSLVVSYINVPFWQQAAPTWTGSNTFQVIINLVDNSILFQYQTQTGSSPSTASNPIESGIENNTGTVGLPYLEGVYPSATSAVKYYYPASTTFQVNDASASYCNNPENGGIFITKNGPPFYMNGAVQNTGNTNLPAFNVTGEVRTVTNALRVRDTQVVSPSNAGASVAVNFGDPFLPVAAGIFKMNCITSLSGDATPSNDTRTLEINVVDASTSSLELSYDDLSTPTTGISWSGGDGGIANYFKPPFYPCLLTQAKEFIITDPGNHGYSIMVFDDDGVNGAPLTLLDSIYVAPGSFTAPGMVTTILDSALRFDDGGFYVMWFMGGDSVQLGRNAIAPFSFRTFEILGSSNPANFSPYRDADVEDFVLHAVIEKVPFTCLDASISAGINAANTSLLCFRDTATFTSSGVVAPNVGTYAGIGWLISSADISGSLDPLSEPSLIGTSRFSFLPPSESIYKFFNDSSLIGTVAHPYGTYYFTPVVFGNGTSGAAAPVLLSELTLDTACIVVGNSVALTIVGESRPIVALTSNSPLLCDSLNLTINLNANLVAGASYSWTGPNGFTSTAQTPSVANATPADSGWYVVTITGTTGCNTTDSTLFVVDTLAYATITTTGSTTFCNGDSVTLTASAGTSYLWSPGNQTTQAITVSTAGTYSSFVTAPNGCNGDATTPNTTVVVNPNPAIPVIAQIGNAISNTVSGTTYQWYLNGVIQPSKTTQNITITAAQNGNWNVVVSNTFGCSSTSNVLSTNVGINELAQSVSVAVYPNPNNGLFTVEIKSASSQKLTLRIFDVTGRVVYAAKTISKEKFTINMSDKAKGVYFLQLNNGTDIVSRKLIVE